MQENRGILNFESYYFEANNVQGVHLFSGLTHFTIKGGLFEWAPTLEERYEAFKCRLAEALARFYTA